jgi:hypothetical protein
MAENGSGRVGRFAAWMGIVFGVTFIVGNLLQPAPKHMKNVQDWATLFNSSSKRTTEVIGAYLVMFGLLAFLWFVTRLRAVLADGSGALLAFASVFAGIGMAGTLIAAAVAGGKIFAGYPVPSGPIAQQLANVGEGMLGVPASLAAGVFVAVAAYLARRDSVLPGWLTIAGYVVAVLQLAGGLFIPLLLVPLWVLIVSIVLMRREARTPATA